MSEKLEFRKQMQGAHEAPFPGPARAAVAEHILGTRQHEIQQHLQNG